MGKFLRFKNSFKPLKLFYLGNHVTYLFSSEMSTFHNMLLKSQYRNLWVRSLTHKHTSPFIAHGTERSLLFSWLTELYYRNGPCFRVASVQFRVQ